ncbi:hypothetical protein BpHYR1_021233 [Brachionus plicatilis]|uniref:Uncharacterized protein n=1 Tax=Brachionus plicatilis TaxID=10195 RepID=A0A3M7RDZ3_BRAPC|nr:hypothetical protein BpHYR1_021233 [Brachionus plicatilis]
MFVDKNTKRKTKILEKFNELYRYLTSDFKESPND